MELKPEEIKSGMRWFWGAGIVAVLFSIWLANADYKLSTSRAEKQLGETLHELRTAQAKLGYRSTDPRQKGDSPVPAFPEMPAGSKDDHSDHGGH